MPKSESSPPSSSGHRALPSAEELLETAVAAAKAAAPVLLGYFGQDRLDVRHKGDHDLVSRADHESEAAIVSTVLDRYPQHCILAEESGQRGGGDVHEWVIDPLDGTSNFLQGLPYFAISIACRRGEELLAAAVLDPVQDQLFTAARGSGAWLNGEQLSLGGPSSLSGSFLATGYPWRSRAALDLYLQVFRELFLAARGIRRCGAAALDLAYTAAGVYDGFFEFRLAPWDIAAGILLLREAGGTVSDLDGGQRMMETGNVLAGPPDLHRELLREVAKHADEVRLEAVDPPRARSTPPAPSHNG